ncbi:WecB/TagA/CpsF family glycosyltransferase [Chitinispirillales bacterium ANBcel5]|uniref:WecB/TagA/CpsF family glycosyltransferase n=1 Tax=Cellulosispirillum alkaliphilum TaxID=3039283 RepID=UPI002A54EA1C|nr:WecB/TagA/CpsF family glycosyltransferase [Chitinispirillales bacterium ANBcel5]
MEQTYQVTPVWPARKEVFGIPVTPTSYKEATDCIIDAAIASVSACIDFMPVHGLMTAVEDPRFDEAIKKKFDMVCPDGQPVRWALNKMHKARLKDRVYGPTLTLRLLKRAEEENIPVYFYGSTEPVLQKLKNNLLEKYPMLIISGMESPPFRALTDQENAETAERINSSGAKILFIGLGCPKQELWAASQKGKITMPMLCVGAAFDFHAGTVKQAPAWMQKRGLEWLYRLCKEPGRLWKRYCLTNTRFLAAYIRSQV